jgi:hypothetical protein
MAYGIDPRIEAAIQAASQQYGVDPNTMRAFSKIENGGRAGGHTGSYYGAFQLSPGEFARYGGTGDITDPTANTMAAGRKLRAESDQFASKYGRAPTPSELYMIHQQGVGGAAEHMKYPDAPAWQNMYATGEGQQKGMDWARRAIWGNIPDDQKAQFGNVDNVTSRQFMDMWAKKVADFGAGNGPAAQDNPTTNPMPGVVTDTPVQPINVADATSKTPAASAPLAFSPPATTPPPNPQMPAGDSASQENGGMAGLIDNLASGTEEQQQLATLLKAAGLSGDPVKQLMAEDDLQPPAPPMQLGRRMNPLQVRAARTGRLGLG